MKLIKYEDLKAAVTCMREELPDVRIVTVSGCFDLFHVGHVRRLQEAKREGEILIVGINSDDSVIALKGIARPIIWEQHRAEIVAALECVDYVTIFPEETSDNFQAIVKPFCHVTGEEHYSKYTCRPHIKYAPRAALASTTGIIRTILARYQDQNAEVPRASMPLTFEHDPE